MSPGATFERVYRAIRLELGSGGYRAAQPLEPAALAAGLNASITPVRDALHRLVGEGLVEAPQGDGFRTPHVTELGLRHLYRWSAGLVVLALHARARPAVADAPGPEAPAMLAAYEALFAAIGARSANPEHVGQIVRVGERLRPVRQVELVLLADLPERLAGMKSLLESDDRPALRRSLAGHHRLLERLAPEIVDRLHAGA